MTTLDIERLVRRITAVIQKTMDASLAPKLAADYEEVVRTVQHRLSQCESMTRAGDYTQAVQLAETAPNLLDCIVLIEFAEVDQWRSYCINQRLPCPNPIDPQAVRLLNDCYNRGIKTDDPLYKAYRKAVLTRDDSEALKTIRSIARLNPKDTTASSERDRLDRKVLESRLKSLSEALSSKNHQLVLNLVNEIEAFGFQSRPAGEVWSQAQIVRSIALLDGAADDQARAQWRNVLLTLESIRSLQSDFHFQLPAEAAARFSALENWARTEELKDKRENEFQSLLAELHYKAQLSEQKDTSAKAPTLAELKSDFEAFHKIWRALEQFSRPISPDAVQLFQKRTLLLGMEIRRRNKRRLLLLAASVAVIFMIGAAISWLILGRSQAAELSSQLKAAMQKREAGAVRRLSELVRESPPRLMGYVDLASSMAAADQFLKDEQARESSYTSAMAKLPAQFPANPTSSQLIEIQHQFTETTNLLATLAPDLRTQHETEVVTFQSKWERFLADQTAAANAALERSVQQGEQVVSVLSYALPYEQVKARLEDLATIRAAIQAFGSGPNVPIRLRGDLERRSNRLLVTEAEYRREMEKYDQAQRMLSDSRTVTAFDEAIGLLARSQFSRVPAVISAKAIASLKHSPDDILRSLLFPSNQGLLDLLKPSQEFSFIPKSVMPKERELFLELRADEPAIKVHRSYKVFFENDSHTPVEWITPAIIDQTVRALQMRVFLVNSGEERFAPKQFQLTYANGRFSLPNGETFKRIELIQTRIETAAYGSASVDKLMDETGESYTRALIPIVADIIKSPTGSPLHKAYLIIRLLEIGQLRPEDWGLPFAPQLESLRLELIEAGAKDIQSGDWFLPDRTKLFSERVTRALNKAAAVPFWETAQGVARLAGGIARDGLIYAGYVDASGQPVLTLDQPAVELIAFARDQSGPAILFNRVSNNWKSIKPAQVLSPVYVLRAERTELLAKSGLDTKAPETRRALPAVFINPPVEK